MKTRDPIAATVALLLLGSIVFLISGIAWFFLADDGSRDRSPLLGGEPAVANETRVTPEADRAKLPPTREGLSPGAARVAVAGRAVTEAAADGRREVLIEGRVLDRHARPIADATVHLVLALGPRSADLDGGVQQSVQTATDGQFAFLGPVPSSEVSIALLVQAEQHAPHVSDHALDAGSSWLDVGDIELLPGGGIAGLIIDGEGRGVADATVSLQPVSGPGNSLARWWSRDVELPKPVFADAVGSYRFAHLLPGTYRITVRAARMQEARPRAPILVEEGKDTEVEPISLGPGLELDGIVLGPRGEAVSGAEVRIRSAAAAIPFNGRTVTSEDGRFRIEHLPSAPQPPLLLVDVQAKNYLKEHLQDVDAKLRTELVIHLEDGLAVTGAVFDSATGAPVERFAARIHLLGALERGTPVHLLRRRIEALRTQASEAKTDEDRRRREAMVLELEARMSSLEHDAPASRSRGGPAEVGPLDARPGGRFTFGGLDEGVYTVEIAAPGCAATSSPPIEVRRDAPARELRIEVVPGSMLSGVVLAKQDGGPIPNASVELVAVADDDPRGGASPSPFAWAFAAAGPRGDVILTARTDAGGRFEIGPAPPGRYFLSAAHEQAGRERTEVFELRGERSDVRIVLRPMASLSGQVREIPAGLESEVVVLAVGGFGAMRTTKAGTDGHYRFDALPPGRYVVRAVVDDAGDAVLKQMAAIFGGDAKAPPADLTLAESERRELDLTLAVPPAGTVEGTVTLNGDPARGFQAMLRSAAGTNAGGRPLRAMLDGQGRFAIRSVPAGDYTVHVTSAASRQEVHREAITVVADRTSWIQANVAVGGLRGRVESGDDTPADRLEGTLTIVPGATTAPADLREYARTHRVHTLRVRAGTFAEDSLTSGSALLIVEIRGRQRIETTVDVPSRGTREIVLTAGKPL